MEKKFFKKSVAWICVITMLAVNPTGAGLIEVKADTVTTTIQTADAERTELMAEIENVDYNFALNKTASVSKLTPNDGGTNLGIITNGKFATGNSKDTIIEIGRGSTDNAWVQVDLGEAYDTSKIDRVAVQYKTAGTSPKTEYIIQYSLNGIDYVDIGDVVGVAGGNNTIYLDKLSMTKEQSEAIPYAKYVRIYCKTNVTAYGLQVKGMAVLTDGTTKVSDVDIFEMEPLENPAALNVTSSDYGQIEYTFEKAEGHEDYIYYAYVDNSRVSDPVLPDVEYKVTGLAAGQHEVKIVSYKDGFASEGISQSITVKDYKSLFTDERNIAVGKIAKASSIRQDEGKEPDLETNITDGKITTLFRTAVIDKTANIVIDLGKQYNIDAMERIVMMFAPTRYPKDYTVEYSEDGEYFEEVSNMTGVASEITSAVANTTECTISKVQYIRINMSNAVAADYGFQIYEIAVVENYIDMSAVDITYDEEWAYTGSQIQPEISVEYDGTTLTADKDYTLTYGENKNVGSGTLTLKGIGRFTGTIEKTFTITKQQMSNVTITTEFDSDNNLIVSASNGAEVLVEDTDYTYTTGIDDNSNLVITFTGIGGNYEGTFEKTIAPEDIPLNDVTDLAVSSPDVNQIIVSFSTPDKVGALSQLYNIYIDDELADENAQAGEYKYTAQTAGTHNVKVVAVIGDRKSDGVEQEVAVSGMDISSTNAEITKDNKVLVYSGTAQTVDITVKYNNEILVKDKDYTVEYRDNVNAGKAKYKVVGIGLYEGSVEGEFSIAPKDLSADSINVETSFDTNKKLAVTVKDGSLAITKGVDYNYTDTTDSEGNITITITGLGKNYTGTLVKKILAKDNPNTIQPTTAAPKKVKAPAKGKINKIGVKKKSAKIVKLSLKKIKGAKGYQIKITKAKKAKKALITKNVNKVNVTIKSNKLKGKKDLFISVRAYAKDEKGKNIYGKWSVVKKVKIK